MLLERGADVTVQAQDGTTALKLAEGGGYTDMVAALKEAGVKE